MAARTDTPPYQSYAVILGAFGGLLATAAGASRLLDRHPASQTTLDFAVLSAASFKAARTLARDDVTSFIRQPFVQGQAGKGGEDPVETGDMQQAIGELVTCTRCVGTWAAAGLTSAQILAPRMGRMLTWSLAAAAVNDWLQAGFAALTAKSNELDERTG